MKYDEDFALFLIVILSLLLAYSILVGEPKIACSILTGEGK